MADASTVIKLLGDQIAQLVIDKTIAQVEVAELKDKLSALEPAE